MKNNQKTLAFIGLGLVTVGGFFVGRYVADNNSTNEPTESNQETINTNESEEEQPAAPQTAIYRITYSTQWSAETHPNTFPAGAHMSPMVVATHQEQTELYDPGGLATPGVKEVAETGATTPMVSEILPNELIHAHSVGSRIDIPGSSSVEIEATQESDLLSFISMIAPSPDWFVGLDGIDLFDSDGSGQWMESSINTVFTYDAGTDSGATFTAADLVTDPQAITSRPVDDQFIEASLQPFGTLLIEKI